MKFPILALITVTSNVAYSAEINCGGLSQAECLNAANMALTNSSAAAGRKFVASYTDPKNGVAWSKPLPVEYLHDCVSENGQSNAKNCKIHQAHNVKVLRFVDAPAAKYCRMLGARLPTIDEVDSLVRNFDHEVPEVNKIPALTARGEDQMLRTFGIVDSFSMSSLFVSAGGADNSAMSYDFVGMRSAYKDTDGIIKWSGFGSVQCVRDRQINKVAPS